MYDFNSLFFLKETSKLRRAIVWFVESPFFETLILCSILGNSLALAFYNYNDREAKTQWNQGLNLAGMIFSVIFLVECILKIMAMGFVLHSQSYLRDGWNFIDFAVVLIGIAEFVGGGVNLKALRALRVLRPLRSINAVPSMRRQVNALISSLPNLGNVTVFLFFVMLIYSILGLHQFQGAQLYKCRYNRQPETATFWKKSSTRVCSPSGQGLFICPKG